MYNTDGYLRYYNIPGYILTRQNMNCPKPAMFLITCSFIVICAGMHMEREEERIDRLEKLVNRLVKENRDTKAVLTELLLTVSMLSPWINNK